MNHFRTLAAAGRVLLGGFVLWQAAFLVAALLADAERGLGDAAPPAEPDRRAWARALKALDKNVLTRYAELTGQRQNWALFAPGVADRFAFVAVELRWDDDGLAPDPGPAMGLPSQADGRPGAASPLAPVFLPGKVEPGDLNAFLRLGGYRVRKYETYIAPDEVAPEVLFGAPAANGPRPDATLVYPDTANQMHTYLRWRLAEFRRERPDLPPPTQVRLWVHTYRIPEPPGPTPWQWRDEGWECVGCWVPGYDTPDAGGKER
jgi:hypothetical protein